MATTKEDALAALAAKSSAEQNLARVAGCPPWRHAVFALVMAVIVASPAVPPLPRIALLLLTIACTLAIIRSDRRRLGVFINGYRRGRTRLVLFPLIALFLCLYAASMYLGVERGHPGQSLMLGAVSFVVNYLGSVLWQRVFLRELGA